MMDSRSIDQKLSLIRYNLELVQNDTIDDKEFDQLMLSHYSSGSWISILIICFLTISVIFVLATIALCFCNWFLVRGRTVIKPNLAVTYQKGQNDLDSDDDNKLVFIRQSTIRSESPLPRLHLVETPSSH